MVSQLVNHNFTGFFVSIAADKPSYKEICKDWTRNKKSLCNGVLSQYYDIFEPANEYWERMDNAAADMIVFKKFGDLYAEIANCAEVSIEHNIEHHFSDKRGRHPLRVYIPESLYKKYEKEDWGNWCDPLASIESKKLQIAGKETLIFWYRLPCVISNEYIRETYKEESVHWYEESNSRCGQINKDCQKANAICKYAYEHPVLSKVTNKFRNIMSWNR